MIASCLLAVVAQLIPQLPGLRLTEREREDISAAVTAGDIRRVDAFLDRNPWRLNAPVWGKSDSLLSIAAQEAQQRLAERLRARGATVDLRSAVRLGWDNEVQALVKADPGSVRQPPHRRSPLILDAVTYGRRSTVKLLLDLGSPLEFEESTRRSHVLTEAVEWGDPETVKLVLARTPDAGLRRVWADAFAEACDRRRHPRGNEAIVRLLFDHRPAPAVFDQHKNELLWPACRRGNVPAVKLLLSAGADPNGTASPDRRRFLEGLTHVHAAFQTAASIVKPVSPNDSDRPRQPSPDEVNYAARLMVHAAARLAPHFAGASVLTDDEEGGRFPPIELAALSADITDERARAEVVDLLVRAGAKWTFRAAVGMGRADLVRTFVAADPGLAKVVLYRYVSNPRSWGHGLRIFDGRPPTRDEALDLTVVYPLELAIERGQGDLIRLLLPLEQPVLPGGPSLVVRVLGTAAVRGNVELVRAILKEPRQAGALKGDWPGVYEAAGESGSLRVLEALAAARPPEKDEAQAALVAAVKAGHLAAAKRASTLGGDPARRSRYGDTTLALAAEQGYVDVIRWLLAERADPDRTRESGDGPLHLAARKDFARCIEVLLAGKADPNLSGSGGQTPLMVAAAFDSPAAVRALVAGGADLRATDPFGRTALHAATAAMWERTVRELIRLGADPQAKDGNGKTPLDFVRLSLASAKPTESARWKQIEALLQAALPKK